MKYLYWDEKTITDFSEDNITGMYETGYVFTRIGKGVMQRTRSARIDLNKFQLSSENRRVLKKVDNVDGIGFMESIVLPMPEYDWKIGKIAKDFYDAKFGVGVMSAQKIKELTSDSTKSNFNGLFRYVSKEHDLGYAIFYSNDNIAHYSYPFYDLKLSPKDMGLGMMIMAIQWAKDKGKKYIYLGSLQRPSDVYKLQFEGLEWFDGKEWRTDLEAVKKILAESPLPDRGDSASPKHIHIIGICGVATGALAVAFHEKGVKITGSDKGFFPPISTELTKRGIPFYAGWHPEKIEESGRPDIIIAGASGTSPSNPEILYAKKNHIPLLSFAEAIGKYFVKKNSIVAAGTWGKTTSSALLSFILLKAGKDPSYFTGGLSLSHDSGALSNSDWSVVEGDEYQISISDKRPKFACYSPTHLLLTAVSWDHADLYPTEESYFETFERLIASIPPTGLIAANKDQAGAVKLLGNLLKDGPAGSFSNSPKVISYGKKDDKNDPGFTYEKVKQSPRGLDFIVNHGKESFRIHSPMIGTFQAENITGCFAMAYSIGIKSEAIIKAVAKFKGLKRRLEKRLDGETSEKGVTIFDDIAHSPEKASSVLANLKEIYSGKIITVFEPNIGGRSRESIAKYDNAFKNADIVIIPRLTRLKVTENESLQPMEGDELARVIAKTHLNTHYSDDDERLINFLITNTKESDTIAFLGSHGFRGMIEEVVEKMKK